MGDEELEHEGRSRGGGLEARTRATMDLLALRGWSCWQWRPRHREEELKGLGDTEGPGGQGRAAGVGGLRQRRTD